MRNGPSGRLAGARRWRTLGLVVAMALCVSALLPANGADAARNRSVSVHAADLPPSCDKGRAGGDLNVKFGQTCSLVSNGDPTKQVRLDFPLDNHHFALISNVGNADCQQYYVHNPLVLKVGTDFTDYGGGSTNSWGPTISGRTCTLVFTGKRS